MPEGRDTTPELGLPQTVHEAVEAALRAEGYDDDGGIVSTVATKRRADVPRGDVSGRRQPQAMKRNPPSGFWPARTAQEKRGPWCLKWRGLGHNEVSIQGWLPWRRYAVCVGCGNERRIK